MIVYILTIELFVGTTLFANLAFESYKDCKTVERIILVEQQGNIKKIGCFKKDVQPQK